MIIDEGTVIPPGCAARAHNVCPPRRYRELAALRLPDQLLQLWLSHGQGYCLRKSRAFKTPDLSECHQVALRKPVCINDLAMQKIFWDRRVVARVLDAINVPTPKRVEVDRDGGPKLDKRVADQLERELGININKPSPPVEFSIKGDESIVVNGKQLDKSFVEKPVSGEDHNIYIYFSERRGGGGRRLFRKVSQSFDVL